MVLKGLSEACERILGLDKSSSVLCVSHDDADGLTAGAIIYRALLREGLTPHQIGRAHV